MKYLLLGSCLVLSTILCAQNNWTPGYIISKTGEQIVGEINDHGWQSECLSIEFRVSKQSEKKTYQASEINGFRIGDRSYHASQIRYNGASRRTEKLETQRSIDYVSTHAFLEQYFDQEVILYRYFSPKGIPHFYLSSPDRQDLVYLEYHRYLDTRNGGKSVKELNGFRNQLLQQLTDCEDVAGNIFELKYRFVELFNLIASWYQCQGQVFELPKSSRRNPLHIGLIAGGSFDKIGKLGFDVFETLDPVQYEFSPTYGIALKYIIPSRQQRLSANLDLQVYNSSAYLKQLNELDETFRDIIETEIEQSILAFQLYFNYELLQGNFPLSIEGGFHYGLVTSYLFQETLTAERLLTTGVTVTTDETKDMGEVGYGLGLGSKLGPVNISIRGVYGSRNLGDAQPVTRLMLLGKYYFL